MLGSVIAAFQQCRLVISSHAGLCHLVCAGCRLGTGLPAGADPSQSRAGRPDRLVRVLLPSRRPGLPQTRAETDAPLEGRKTFPGRVRGTADPSASLGMTKRRGRWFVKICYSREGFSCVPAATSHASPTFSFVHENGFGSAISLPRTTTLSFLSSRAKPRDLRFYGPFVEMFLGKFRQATHPNTPPCRPPHPPLSHPAHQSQPARGCPQPQSTAASSYASIAPPPR